MAPCRGWQVEFPDDPQWRPGRHGLYQYYHNHNHHHHVILILLIIISNHDDDDPPLPHHVNDDHVDHPDHDLFSQVAQCAGCNVYEPWAAMVIGAGAAFVYLCIHTLMIR